jgi:hypothetical protein
MSSARLSWRCSGLGCSGAGSWRWRQRGLWSHLHCGSNKAMELAPALAGAHKAVGVDAMAGTGTMAGRVTLQLYRPLQPRCVPRTKPTPKLMLVPWRSSFLPKYPRACSLSPRTFERGGLVLATRNRPPNRRNTKPGGKRDTQRQGQRKRPQADKNVLRNQCSRRRSSPVVIRELLAARARGHVPRPWPILKLPVPSPLSSIEAASTGN